MLLGLLWAWLLLASAAELPISRAPPSRSPTSISTARVPDSGHRVVVVVLHTGPVSHAKRGDFNKVAERDLRPGGSEYQRRISQLEAAFRSACVPGLRWGDTHCGVPAMSAMVTSGPNVAGS